MNKNYIVYMTEDEVDALYAAANFSGGDKFKSYNKLFWDIWAEIESIANKSICDCVYGGARFNNRM